MGFSKTEINFRRLLEAAPRQQNQAKLIHYVSTLREQLEELSEERTPEGLPRLSKSLLNDYSQKIESLSSKLSTEEEEEWEESIMETSANEEIIQKDERGDNSSPPGLRRRHVSSPNVEDRSREDSEEPVKLDSAAHAHIEKHRKLQDDLTDEMVGLATQLKESSLLVSQSLKNNVKMLDSTEVAIEKSLASTGHVASRVFDISSQSFQITCFTWLLFLVMTCIFFMVVLFIRIT